MNILLINPPYAADPLERKLGNYMPPLNLLYLASFLERAGHRVRILDLYAAPLPTEKVISEARLFGAAIAGFATYSQNMTEVYGLCLALKKSLPGLKTVLGGLYASFLPQQCLKENPVDFVAAGEGEETLTELAAAIEEKRDPSSVKGLFFRGPGGAVTETPQRPLIADLDALGPPAWHLVDLSVYRLPPNRAVTGRRAASVLTARGCNYRCSFCAHHYGYGGNVRKRSVAGVLEEIKTLVREYGVRELRFEDCTFTAEPERVKELCRGLIAAGLGLAWNCDVRADTASDELFSLMRAAGCRRIFIGVESASEKILNSMAVKKGTHLGQASTTVALAKKHGMRVTASFVIGVPGETEATAEETYRFALKLDPDYAMFTALVPSVGSELFDRALQEGQIDLSSYRGSHYLMLCRKAAGPVRLCGLEPRRLLELMGKFNAGFYGRPGYLLKRLIGIRSPLEIKQLFWGALLVLRRGRPLAGGFSGKPSGQNRAEQLPG